MLHHTFFIFTTWIHHIIPFRIFSTMDPQITNLVENFAYDVSTGAKLEAHVVSQLSQKTYDFLANKALLKNYQVNNDILKVDFVCNVLILSLMRLPSTDFLAITYLIPTKLITNSNVMLIQKCADFLERGKFHQFWEEYVTAPETLFSQANGFVDFIRLFILSNLRDTFKNIPKTLFQQQLGLNESSIVSFCESNKLIDKVSDSQVKSSTTDILSQIAGDDVVFVSNDENQNKSQQFDENLRVDEVILCNFEQKCSANNLDARVFAWLSFCGRPRPTESELSHAWFNNKLTSLDFGFLVLCVTQSPVQSFGECGKYCRSLRLDRMAGHI